MYDEPNKEHFTLMQPGSAGKKRHLLRNLLIFLVLAGLATAYGIKLWNKYHSEPKSEQEPEPARETAMEPEQPLPAEAGPILDRIAECRALFESDKPVQARKAAYALLEKSDNPHVRKRVEELLGEINIDLATTPKPMEEKVDYIIEQGDNLGKIARKYNTTVELLKKSNGISGKIIHPGDRLSVLQGKYLLSISKSRNDMVLTVNDRFFKRYSVGTGKYGKTPTGTFKIDDKIPNPPWWTDGEVIPFGDERNVLGTRWMSLQAAGDTPPAKGYGIHGTWEPNTVGQQASDGCIRLHNSDVEELFMLVPLGTKVEITE